MRERVFMVGREKEQRRLRELADSGEAEFVVVFGRRRVGKTYLVRETFDGDFTFCHSGMARVGMAKQLQSFRSSLREWGDAKCPRLTNWIDAFDELKQVIKTSERRRKIVFIDEMPWMDTPKSGFVPALEHFWNGWASGRRDVMLVVCGSATSWIIDKVLRNKGGLHDRVTGQIALEPFTLRECELYAQSRGLDYTKRMVIETYMVLGGIPYYWRMLRRGMSPAHDFDELFFSPKGQLRFEFDELYASLFRRKEPYVRIVTALGEKSDGLSREELLAASGFSDGGRMGKYLEELESCGFIRKFHAMGKKTKDAVFQLIDNYTLFHLRFVADGVGSVRRWTDRLETSEYYAWAGCAFERVCLQHVNLIKRALEIGGVKTEEYSWRGLASDGKPAQIDLLIDRNDGIADICEMKFTKDAYALTEDEWNRIVRRRGALRSVLSADKAIHVVMVTAQPMIRNAWSKEVMAFISGADLFG